MYNTPIVTLQVLRIVINTFIKKINGTQSLKPVKEIGIFQKLYI